jgi:radical SAM superfamily enzyme YgiQ (UPF0313 family)
VPDVLLLSCYELGHQPVSLASPLAALAEAGIQAHAIDTYVETVGDADIAAARLVAISAPMHTAMRLAHDLAGRVRAVNPRAQLTMYGLYAWLNAEHLFAEGLADSVIGGEFEQPLVDLARSVLSGSRRPGSVRYPDRYAPPHLGRTTFLVPSRESLPPPSSYAGLLREGQTAPGGYVEATRGCKHTCAHCPITPVYQGRFFAVPREIVLADVRNQVAAGARHITFGDPDFLNGPSHSLRILRALHEEFPDVTFDATIKIEHILRHSQLLPELRALGCAFVVSAVESLSDTILTKLRKGHTADDVSRALDVMDEASLPLRPSLLSFTPWTTLDDYVRMLHFVERRGLIDRVDPVQYGIRLLLPPGSTLVDEPDAPSWLGALDHESFSYRWTHPDPRMDALHGEVTSLAEQAEREGWDVWRTFSAIRAAAHRAAGLKPVRELVAAAGREASPRLTESWFC